MRIVPPIKMHNDSKKEHIDHTERLFDALSLDVALFSKIIVQFYRQYQWQALAHGDGGYSIGGQLSHQEFVLNKTSCTGCSSKNVEKQVIFKDSRG